MPLIVVVVYVPSYPFLHLHPIVKRMKIDVFVLDGTPEPLDPNVVLASSTAIHTDLYTIPFQCFFPFLAGILTALVGIEDFRGAMTSNGTLQHL